MSQENGGAEDSEPAITGSASCRDAIWRANQFACGAFLTISFHLLGTLGKLRGTIPVPSLTAVILSMGLFVSLSTCPLGQVISNESILVRFPKPKWIRGSLADI